MRQSLLCALLLFGCGSSTSNNNNNNGKKDMAAGEFPDVITITPANATLTSQDGVAATQSFTVTGTFNGTDRDITAQVLISVDQPIGSFDGALFTSSTTRGGKATVRASLGAVEGSTTVSVVLKRSTIGTDAPTDAPSKFSGADDAARNATVLYPNDNVLVPPNLSNIDVMWTAAVGTNLFDLNVTSAYLDLHFYTKDPHVELTPEMWKMITDTHRGDEFSYVVRATAEAGGGVGKSTARKVLIAEENVNGAVYYWSPTKSGTVRFDFTDPTSKASDYYTMTESGGNCVGCHVLSRNGQRYGVRLGGGQPNIATVLETGTRNKLFETVSTIQWNLMAFNPDASKMITTNAGVITLRDATTGLPTGTTPTMPTGGSKATHPDWSPDGNKIAFVTSAVQADLEVTAGSIQVIDYNDGNWGTPSVLVASVNNMNNYYPMFSPDNAWVLFNRAAFVMGLMANQNDSNDNQRAELWIVKSAGGDPVKMEKAGAAETYDSWPRWSPFQQTYKGKPIMWFTWSSRRAYGNKLAANARPQLWMSAFDPEKASQGQDPSYPAFWMPQQDITTSNHTAQWTETFVPIN